MNVVSVWVEGQVSTDKTKREGCDKLRDFSEWHAKLGERTIPCMEDKKRKQEHAINRNEGCEKEDAEIKQGRERGVQKHAHLADKVDKHQREQAKEETTWKGDVCDMERIQQWHSDKWCWKVFKINIQDLTNQQAVLSHDEGSRWIQEATDRVEAASCRIGDVQSERNMCFFKNTKPENGNTIGTRCRRDSTYFCFSLQTSKEFAKRRKRCFCGARSSNVPEEPHEVMEITPQERVQNHTDELVVGFISTQQEIEMFERKQQDMISIC